MHPSDVICRYVGRSHDDAGSEPNTFDDPNSFDDTVLARTLHDSLASATVLMIDDPMSFPWNSIDPDLPQLLVIDARDCSSDDLAALRPVLRALTPADTIIGPAGLEPALSAEFGSRAEPPSEDDAPRLLAEKHLHRQDRRIRDEVLAEIGDDAILHRIAIDGVAASGISMGEHLAALADELGADLAGVWGVRAQPGAPVHHGWAAFAPRQVDI